MDRQLFLCPTVDFALLSSAKKKNRIQEINPNIDKQTSGYKRRLEAIKSKPKVVLSLLDHTLEQGIMGDYVLMIHGLHKHL